MTKPSIVGALLCLLASPLTASVEPPPGAGWIDVRALFGAIPDDGLDDTGALQQAISFFIGNRTSMATLYLPDGVYNISAPLEWKNNFGEWKVYLQLQGQSRDGTILRLADNTFTDSNNPQAVLFTASSNGGGPERPDGSGNTAFCNYIHDLTVDVASGNPGAVGIDFHANNAGAVRNVKIVSSDPAKLGYAGILMQRDAPGPALLEDVEIDGFSHGLDFGNRQNYSTTVERITLRNQKTAAIRNNQHALAIRQLLSENTVPVLTSANPDGRAHTVIIDSAFTGGSPTNYAVNYQGGLFLRDIAIDGYLGSPVYNGNTLTAEGANPFIAEYVSHPVVREFTSPAKSMRLPVEETPAGPADPVTNWVKVNAYNSSAIQAALDSAASQGKTTVYLPRGQYDLTGPVTVHGSVQRLFLNHAFLVWNPASGVDNKAFILQNMTGPAFIFERCITANVPGETDFTWIHDETTIPVVLRDITSNSEGVPYLHTQPKKIFIENCAMGGIAFNNARVWARQFNPENADQTKIINDGGDLWVLGLKTEWAATVLENINGARAELLGTFFYPPFWSNPTHAGIAIVNTESQLTFVGTGSGDRNDIQVRDTRYGVTRDYTFVESQAVGHPRFGLTTPLFVSWENYGTWADGFSTTTEGDENGDGVPNVVAYALGAASDEDALPLLPIVYDLPGALAYEIPQTPKKEILYEILASGDMQTWNRLAYRDNSGTWSEDPAHPWADSTQVNPTTDGVQVETPLAAPNDRQFYRLKIQLPD